MIHVRVVKGCITPLITLALSFVNLNQHREQPSPQATPKPHKRILSCLQMLRIQTPNLIYLLVIWGTWSLHITGEQLPVLGATRQGRQLNSALRGSLERCQQGGDSLPHMQGFLRDDQRAGKKREPLGGGLRQDGATAMGGSTRRVQARHHRQAADTSSPWWAEVLVFYPGGPAEPQCFSAGVPWAVVCLRKGTMGPASRLHGVWGLPLCSRRQIWTWRGCPSVRRCHSTNYRACSPTFFLGTRRLSAVPGWHHSLN